MKKLLTILIIILSGCTINKAIKSDNYNYYHGDGVYNTETKQIAQVYEKIIPSLRSDLVIDILDEIK